MIKTILQTERRWSAHRQFFATLLLFITIFSFVSMAQNFTPPPTTTDDDGNTLGTILFSKKPIIEGKEKQSEMTTTFTDGDQVFAMAYLPGTLEDLGFSEGFIIKITELTTSEGYRWDYISGKVEFNQEGGIKGIQPFYDLDIFVGAKDVWRVDMTKTFLKSFLSYLNRQGSKAQRKYTFKVELYANNTPRAAGSFTLDLTQSNSGIKALVESHERADMAEKKLPPSKRNDPALTGQIKKLLAAKGINDVVAVLYTSADWYLQRHKISGVILYRGIFANVVYKEKDGTCAFKEYNFKQDFIGNNFSSQLREDGYAESGKILCENVK